jgi:uncharacterized membrane protein
MEERPSLKFLLSLGLVLVGALLGSLLFAYIFFFVLRTYGVFLLYVAAGLAGLVSAAFLLYRSRKKKPKTVQQPAKS